VAVRRRLVWRRALMLASAFTVCGAQAAAAQASAFHADPEEAARRLIVRIDGDIGFGAGIIMGARRDTLWIATANHVVRRAGRAAERIEVRLRWRADPVPARLHSLHDDTLDLAVIAIAGLKDMALDPDTLPFDHLGDLGSLERGDAMFLLGHPNGLPWRVNTAPERFIEFRGDSMDFESNLIARGHSGGALLDERRGLIGMLQSDQPPYGLAISMHAIARRFDAWELPVALKLRPATIAAANGRTCLLRPRGGLRCWGQDDRYEAGPIEADRPLETISFRDDHLCGIAGGGRALCAGNNSNGQLGDGNITDRYHGFAAVAGGLAFESIATGSGHTCGIVDVGDVYCWGYGEYGQLGDAAGDTVTAPVRLTTNERFRSLSAFWLYTCGIGIEGGAWCWGGIAASNARYNDPVRRWAPELAFVALATGHYHVCGIATDGATYCWGFNDDAQFGDGTVDEGFTESPHRVSGSHAFRSLSAGVGHTCAVTAEGAGYCWGLNNRGQLGIGSTIDSRVPVRVKGDLVFESISAGWLHTCGITRDGVVWCWGDNTEGGVGSSGQEMHTEPWRVPGLPENERTPWRTRK
jgi:hypothetical protein